MNKLWTALKLNLQRELQPDKESFPPIDQEEIDTDQNRRANFLRFLNRGWLIFGLITLVALPFNLRQWGVFSTIIIVTALTYLTVRTLNQRGQTRLAGFLFSFLVDLAFYGLFILLVWQLGALEAFATQATVLMLMGFAVIFAGALINKWAAFGAAALNSLLLIVTYLALAPTADPRPSIHVFWWLLALSVWIYEGTLSRAFARLRATRGNLVHLVETRTLNLQQTVAQLSKAKTDLEANQQAVAAANRQLTLSLDELQQRTHSSNLLNEMSDRLQACLTVEDAYAVCAHLAPQLFPEEAGVLYSLNASRNLMEAVAEWGRAVPNHPDFEPDACCGLLQMHLHVNGAMTNAASIGSGNFGPVCRHIESPELAASVCVPLVLQGNALGLMHLRYTPQIRNTSSGSAAGQWFTEVKQQLCQSVADSLALALANLILRETLRQQSIHDPVTSLFNRRYMEETLERELHRAARGKEPVGIIMVDIDHFKHFNDTFGHEAGDRVLREVGACLSSQIRVEDIACRYGGEEFTLIMPSASPVVTLERAERAREKVKRIKVEHNGQWLGELTASFGVAAFPGHGTTAGAVLAAADAALYQAKHEGRDRVVVSAGSPGSGQAV
jgi:diguanylate cyclase (GGDEF)-like protein